MRIVSMLRKSLLGLLLTCFACPVWGAEPATRPNIIYILLDDAGYGDFSCYGQQKFQTPHIDQLAADGMRFTQHYSGSTVCAPTRCALMTGLHTGHCVVRGNREVQPEGQAPMPAKTVTIPRLLKQAGYVTGMYGKWGLGAPGSPSDPMEHFDYFFGYNCQRKAHNYYPDALWENDQLVPLDGQVYAHDLIMARSHDFLRKQHRQPFFLYLPVVIPHAAMQVPEAAQAPFREKFPEFEGVVGRYAGTTITNPIAAFAAMMTRLDSQVGELRQLVRELGIEENTLILFTSDNGPHKEGGHNPDFFNSNGPFRGYKRDLYEGGIRAPLLAVWQGKIAPGSISHHISAHWDMLPTFCELAGVAAPENIDGISMVPELLGRSGEQRQHDYLYWEFTERNRSQAVRQGDWKGVRNNIRQNPNSPLELYNLASDPGEQTNLADQHPEIVQQLNQLLKTAHTPSTTFPLFDPTP